ncbi:MAG TPA: hypothetical protein VFT45_28190 [Longimicrobium sp.]|nr:hypothetical protein [Longimicrobium sp.]
MRVPIIVMVLSLAACGETRGMPPSANAPRSEAGAVYSVLLDSMERHEPGTRLIHRYVQVETLEGKETAPRRNEDLLRGVPEVTPELLAAFRAANEQVIDVRALAARDDVEWITRDSLDGVRRGRRENLTSPSAFSTTRFSAVGFSADGRTALAYVSYWCGGLCGNEHWALLERQADGRWVMRRALVTVIS